MKICHVGSKEGQTGRQVHWFRFGTAAPAASLATPGGKTLRTTSFSLLSVHNVVSRFVSGFCLARQECNWLVRGSFVAKIALRSRDGGMLDNWFDERWSWAILRFKKSIFYVSKDNLYSRITLSVSTFTFQQVPLKTARISTNQILSKV